MIRLILLISCLSLFLTSCVKDGGSISNADSVGTTAGSSGATTSGNQQPGIDDPLAAHAWHLENTGQSSFSSGSGIAGEDINLKNAIDSGFTGLGVRIAVSDSGTDLDHEDLSGNQLIGEHRDYFIQNSSLWRGSLPYYVGDDSHGTGTVGLIAALGWNGLGSRGVAPKAKYAAFRFVGDYSSTPTTQLARDIDQTDGNFDIFNYSYGYTQCFFQEEDELALLAFKDGVQHLRNGLGALYIQSSGSDYYSSLKSCLEAPTALTYAGNSNHSDSLAIQEKIVVAAVNSLGEYGDDSPAMLTTDISGCAHG